MFKWLVLLMHQHMYIIIYECKIKKWIKNGIVQMKKKNEEKDTR